MALLGCQQVFGDVPPLLERLLGIEVSTSQVYRSTLSASDNLESEKLEAPSGKLSEHLEDPDQMVYAMVDGSMLLLDGGWQEVKLGRVFTSSCLVDKGGRNVIEHSEYVAQRGHFQKFTSKFEKLLPSESPVGKVFITDGAEWIGKWVSARYPRATQILDFYHVAEKLGEAGQLCGAGPDWLEQQKELLKKGKIQKIRNNVTSLNWRNKEKERKLLTYLDKNKYRMAYDQYLKEGLMIGSGPIESAHRTVLQKRMKLSGQRWGENGGDKMIDLRVAVMSSKVDLITDIFRNAA